MTVDSANPSENEAQNCVELLLKGEEQGLLVCRDWFLAHDFAVSLLQIYNFSGKYTSKTAHYFIVNQLYGYFLRAD